MFDNTAWQEARIQHDLGTYWGRLRYLADFIETKPLSLVCMSRFHCGTAHCALGWAETMPEFQALGIKSSYHVCGRDLIEVVEHNISIFGITVSNKRYGYCFGYGAQFYYLGRLYTPADVARHLRETADELEVKGVR